MRSVDGSSVTGGQPVEGTKRHDRPRPVDPKRLRLRPLRNTPQDRVGDGSIQSGRLGE